jgi:hypothetical protein
MTRNLCFRFQHLGGVVLLFLASCGPGRGDLEGKVTYEGKPVTYGDVSVFGGDGEIRQGRIAKDGSYVIKDIGVGGELRFTVNSPSPEESRPKTREKKSTGKVGVPQGNENPDIWFAIPDDYADMERSGLRYQVKRGKNTWDIKLTEKK